MLVLVLDLESGGGRSIGEFLRSGRQVSADPAHLYQFTHSGLLVSVISSDSTVIPERVRNGIQVEGL